MKGAQNLQTMKRVAPAILFSNCSMTGPFGTSSCLIHPNSMRLSWFWNSLSCFFLDIMQL
jgi:hypothetical protein